MTAGCSEPTVKFDVQVNQRAELGAVQSIAVLEFGWTPPGARRVQPDYYRSGSRPTRKTASPADQDDFEKSRPGGGDDSRTTSPPPEPRKGSPSTSGDNAQTPRPSPDERSGDAAGTTDHPVHRYDLAAYDDEDEDEDEEDEEDEDEDDEDEEGEEDEDEDVEDESDEEEEEYDVDDELPLYVLNAGQTVADQVAASLLSLGRYTVRERRELSRVLEEHDLSVTDIMAGQQYALVGGLLSVDGLVVGEVHTFSDRGAFSTKVSFSCRCIATRSGDVLWSMSGELDDKWPGTTLLHSSREMIRVMVENLGHKLNAADTP